MRRFPDELLAASRAIPCADIAPDLGLSKARERGKWSCPLCGSSDGLHCYPDGRGAHCFVCGTSADPIALTRAALGLDFPGAVRWLCERQGWPLEATQTASSSTTRPTYSPNPSPRYTAPVRAPSAPLWAGIWREREALALEGGDVTPERAAQLATESTATAVRKLWLDVVALLPAKPSRLVASWCKRRRLPLDLVDWVGWRSCTGEAWTRLVERLAERRGEDLCAAAGLLRGDNPFPRVASDCELVLMPYWRGEAFDDAPGAYVDTLRFRLMRPDGSRELLNLPNPDPDGWTPSHARPTWHSPSGPYLLSAAHKARQLTTSDAPLYLCEGESDCLALWACGAPAAATPGASAWRSGWAAQLALAAPDAPRVVRVITDNDAAGEGFVSALERDVDALGDDLDRVEVYAPTPCKDVGELHERDLLRDTLAQLA